MHSLPDLKPTHNVQKQPNLWLRPATASMTVIPISWHEKFGLLYTQLHVKKTDLPSYERRRKKFVSNAQALLVQIHISRYHDIHDVCNSTVATTQAESLSGSKQREDSWFMAPHLDSTSAKNTNSLCWTGRTVQEAPWFWAWQSSSAALGFSEKRRCSEEVPPSTHPRLTTSLIRSSQRTHPNHPTPWLHLNDHAVDEPHSACQYHTPNLQADRNQAARN